MLLSIKSIFILKKSFSYVYGKKKLNLITYNKKLQKILNIDIVDFRRFSFKYIIGSRNGPGKEYRNYDDKLLFEGDYLNGKRNGKGREYNNKDELIFDGEFLKGKRHGIGKEYKDNKLLFES